MSAAADGRRGPTLSVVIPVYNGEATVAAAVRALLQAGGGRSVQVVLVDDGSQDGSARVCGRLAAEHPEAVTFLRLSRNFGEHNAVMAGLSAAVGDFVVVMDDDLQHDALDAFRLADEASSRGLDLVYGSFAAKRHSWWRNAGSRFNGWAAEVLWDKPPALYLSSFKCMSRWLVAEVLSYKGPYPYIDGLALRATASVGSIEVGHRERAAGRSGYNLRRLGRLWLAAATAFSVLPLRISSMLGFVMVAFGGLLTFEVVGERLLSQAVPPGWSFLVVLILVFSGVQMIMLGVIGEYLGRLYLSSGEKPQYAVRERRGLGA